MADYKGPDWEWRLQLTALVAEIKTNQDNLDKKIDAYIEASQTRLVELEGSVYGRKDAPGLHEEVRDLKGKWAIFYGIGILIGSAVLNQVVDNVMVKATRASVVSEASAADIKR